MRHSRNGTPTRLSWLGCLFIPSTKETPWNDILEGCLEANRRTCRASTWPSALALSNHYMTIVSIFFYSMCVLFYKGLDQGEVPTWWHWSDQGHKVTLSPVNIYEACGLHAAMKSAVGPVRVSGEEDSSASALDHGSGSFTDGQRPVVAGSGKRGLGRRETTNAICTGLGRL